LLFGASAVLTGFVAAAVIGVVLAVILVVVPKLLAVLAKLVVLAVHLRAPDERRAHRLLRGELRDGMVHLYKHLPMVVFGRPADCPVVCAFRG
jgi:hypothetical protein